MTDGNSQARVWNSRRREKRRRLSNLTRNGKVISTNEIVRALETVIMPGDKVVIELSPYDLTRGRITYRYK